MLAPDLLVSAWKQSKVYQTFHANTEISDDTDICFQHDAKYMQGKH